MGSEYGGTIDFQYESDSKQHSPFLRADILAAALEDWRTFVGNPEEESLPWNTSVKAVMSAEGDWAATVTIRWERVA